MQLDSRTRHLIKIPYLQLALEVLDGLLLMLECFLTGGQLLPHFRYFVVNLFAQPPFSLQFSLDRL